MIPACLTQGSAPPAALAHPGSMPPLVLSSAEFLGAPMLCGGSRRFRRQAWKPGAAKEPV